MKYGEWLEKHDPLCLFNKVASFVAPNTACYHTPKDLKNPEDYDFFIGEKIGFIKLEDMKDFKLESGCVLIPDAGPGLPEYGYTLFRVKFGVKKLMDTGNTSKDPVFL
jgi:hypothetical protein